MRLCKHQPAESSCGEVTVAALCECVSAGNVEEAAAVHRDGKTSVQEDDKLSLLTWNIDGLDGEEQPERARGLCSYIQE